MNLLPFTKYKLRISCNTYNHASYIEDAMNGFCMQKTDFPFLAIIFDDASTDGESDVIRKFLDDNFDMPNARHDENEDAVIIAAIHKDNTNCHFLVVLLKYNFYSIKKAKSPLIKGWYEDVPYVALCEGDDYWTEPNKLQTQVDFLELHPEHSMCFHDVEVKAEKGRDWYDAFGVIEDREYEAPELIKFWKVPTCSMVIRAACLKNYPHNEKFRMGDNVMVMHCISNGKVRGFSKKMGTYRLVPTGWLGTITGKKNDYAFISHYIGMMEEFPLCRCLEMYQNLENKYFSLMATLKAEGNMEEFNRIKQMYMEYPGEVHIEKFHAYYRKERLRRLTKKVLGRRMSLVVSRIKQMIKGRNQ